VRNPFRAAQRANPPITWQGLLDQMQYLGHSYPLLPQQTMENKVAEISRSFGGLGQGAFQGNGVVFACMLVRMLLFSEARFQFRQIRNGRPGDLFGTPELGILETPWVNGTTGDLLSRAIQDADLEGNFYALRRGDRLIRMRPDWVAIMMGVRRDAIDDLDVEIAGYQYFPGGYHSGSEPVSLLREQVAHFAPIPDPLARYRGMSWLTPVLREIMADQAATQHKETFFANAATPNLLVKFDLDSVAKMRPWIDLFREQHEGAANAFRTLFLNAGTDATAIGHTFQEIEFKETQGAGETRIAAAAGVPPVIVGLSEGLDAATYSNYAQARRRFADGTMRPLWRNIAGSLASIVKVPAGSMLWYDDRDIPFLAEDKELAANIQLTQATAMSQLITGGWDPDSIQAAITSGDWSLLTHSGLFSKQLMPPGEGNPPALANGSSLALPAGAKE
jgi:hypothetical protein